MHKFFFEQKKDAVRNTIRVEYRHGGENNESKNYLGLYRL